MMINALIKLFRTEVSAPIDKTNQLAEMKKRLKIKDGYVVINNPRSKIFLLIDCSGSMRDDKKMQQAKKGAVAFAKSAIAKGYPCPGLISFGRDVRMRCRPEGILLSLESVVSEMSADGGTPMDEAIKIARNKLSSGDIIVLVTDGIPDDEEDTLDEAAEAKKAGIEIIAIGTDPANLDFLRQISSQKELAEKVSVDNLSGTIALAAEKLSLLTYQR